MRPTPFTINVVKYNLCLSMVRHSNELLFIATKIALFSRQIFSKKIVGHMSCDHLYIN